MTRDNVELFQRLKKLNPRTPKDMTEAGFKLKVIGSGAFRKTYSILGWGAVIKFPTNPAAHDSNLHHARTEIKTLRKIHTYNKYKVLRPFVPEVYFSNYATGVIAMKQYKKVGNRQADTAARILSELFKQVFNKSDFDEDSDIESYNIMGEYEYIDRWDGTKVKHLKKLVLIDLGLV